MEPVLFRRIININSHCVNGETKSDRKNIEIVEQLRALGFKLGVSGGVPGVRSCLDASGYVSKRPIYVVLQIQYNL